MKKFLSALLACSMLMLGACSSSSDETTTDDTTSEVTDGETTSETVRVALLLPYIGDQSYFDVTYEGLQLADEAFDNMEVQLIEMGTDSADWDTANLQAAAEGYDVIISGNFEYEGSMLAVAADNLDIQYINFDYSDYDANMAVDNVYAVTYNEAQIGYLAGVVAALKSESGIIGAVGGMENASIQTFIGGYMQGALAVNPDIQVLVSYVGSFSDSTTAKEMATNMYNQGADVIWHAAGGAGNGVFEAAAELDFWAIGVDNDQYATFVEANPEIAEHILTSSMKRCDQGLLNALTTYMENGSLTHEAVTMGLAEGGVGLAKNDNYEANMTDEQKATVEEQEAGIIDGSIEIVSVKDNLDYYDTLVAEVSD